MGQAKQRGTYEERKAQAIAETLQKRPELNGLTPESLTVERSKARRRMRSPLSAAMLIAAMAGISSR